MIKTHFIGNQALTGMNACCSDGNSLNDPQSNQSGTEQTGVRITDKI